jgi:GTP-binding protein
MFTDTASLSLQAGSGGNGVVAWRREKFIPKGGPCGGNGGPGGSVIIRADTNFRSLDTYRNRSLIKAENGGSGGPNNKQGKRGRDAIIRVPCGTLVKEMPSGRLLADLTRDGDEYIACHGGKGGLGNTFFKTATNQAPAKSTPGKEGDALRIELELKLIADIGFLGLPNAGKSTLLAQIGARDIKTGAYPFTTLKPNILTLEFDDYSRIRIADIPGIIEGAHEGKGLGHTFLRHIERTKAIVFVIDMSGIDGRSPVDDLATLRSELAAYSPSLLTKPSLIACNKVDTEAGKEAFETLEIDGTSFPISAASGEGVATLIEQMKLLAQADGKTFL